MDDSKLAAKELVNQFKSEAKGIGVRVTGRHSIASARRILDSPPDVQVSAALILADEVGEWRPLMGAGGSGYANILNINCVSKSGCATVDLLAALLQRSKLPYSTAHFVDLLRGITKYERVCAETFRYVKPLISLLEHQYPDELPIELRSPLQQLGVAIDSVAGRLNQEQANRIRRLLGDTVTPPIAAGEAWSDVAIKDINVSPAGWPELVTHCMSATSGKPSARWLKQAAVCVRTVGVESFRTHFLRWIELLDLPRTQPMRGYGQHHPALDLRISDSNAIILKGLVWCTMVEGVELDTAVLRDLALSAYKKIPGVGPRLVALGNACIYVLGQTPGLDAVAQLAFLKVKVKFATAQKLIEKAFNAAAEREGLPREEIEEMAVPAYGLTDVGMREEQLGDFTARLEITGTSTTALTWIKPDGKPQKSVPKAVKDDHADDLKELKAAAKDIQKMLPAQRDRIDQLFLQQKTWANDTWAERYLNHPLVGYISRRLIWVFDQGDHETVSAAWLNGELVDAEGNTIQLTEEAAVVSLWHPIGRSEDEIFAWRRFFERNEIQQPFKQAHREVYLLTDAEHETNIYSNRFAAHIIRQHQFNALCAVRGWRNSLRLMVDDDYPPARRELPAYGLRAEFWVEGAGDAYGVDTNETGTYIYLATDQVRFYPIDSSQLEAHAYGGGYTWQRYRGGDVPEAIPIAEIPALVLSEVLRDIDLFVGVASVGNDAAWEDGGPHGRYRDYWHSYSFGDLSETAQTRKSLLERLVPRLKIANRCSFEEKFLIVRGDVRTYKIHLGSGNIMMAPNDQYLCIVAGRGVDKKSDGIFLPFEGDRTLSIILSKAFLLAEDSKISDSTILSQIRR